MACKASKDITINTVIGVKVSFIDKNIYAHIMYGERQTNIWMHRTHIPYDNRTIRNIISVKYYPTSWDHHFSSLSVCSVRLHHAQL